MPQWVVSIHELPIAQSFLTLLPRSPRLVVSFARHAKNPARMLNGSIRGWKMTDRLEAFRRPVPRADFTVRSKWRTAGMAAGLTGVMGAVVHRIDDASTCHVPCLGREATYGCKVRIAYQASPWS